MFLVGSQLPSVNYTRVMLQQQHASPNHARGTAESLRGTVVASMRPLYLRFKTFFSFGLFIKYNVSSSYLVYTPNMEVGSHRIGKNVGIFPIPGAFFWCRFYSGVFNMLKPRCAKRACPGRMPEARVQPVTGHATGLPSCQMLCL